MTDDPEDIFSSSLGTLFDYMTVAHSSPGSEFVYTSPDNEGVVVTLTTPDSAAQNWTLHASSIWVASIFIADHIHELNRLMRTDECETQIINVLELGAGAGLPSILLAKTRPNTRIVCSDYPDAAIIRALRGNLACNGVAARCTVVPFAWGSDPAALLAYAPGGFDCLLAADTLWDPDSHELLVDTIAATLSRQASARAHLVAGLHTGRYTIESFLARARQRGFLVVSAVERQVAGEGARGLDVYREESEDDKERRRWVVWIQLSWAMDWEVQQM